MTIIDLVLLGLNNMWRQKLRAALTITGVVVGIGALSAMVSFGSGIQKNIIDAFYDNDLFTSMIVTPKEIRPDEMGAEEILDAVSSPNRDGVQLTDSLVQQIRQTPGVALAFPGIDFPARIHFQEDSATVSLSVLPAAARNFKPYNDLLAGTFYPSDTSDYVVIREDMLASRFNIRLLHDGGEEGLHHGDTVKGVYYMHPDSLIGKRITLVSMTLDPGMMAAAMMRMMGGSSPMPVKEHRMELTIGGIVKSGSQFFSGMQRGHLYISPGLASRIPRMGFSSVQELLNRSTPEDVYASIQVRVHDMEAMAGVRKVLDEMGVGVFSIADQLGEIRRQFMVLNAALGAIGAIALLVAGLGITNTMVMSILERKREIGIMKAIGGSEQQIRMIFFVEASVIGVIGAVLGLILGWVVTRIAGVIINMELQKAGEAPVDMFYFSPWLIGGAIAFAIVVSLVAGLYPAIRAARIDPVRALRHD